MPAAVKAPAKGGLNKDRLAKTGKSAPAPPPPAKKAGGSTAAPASNGGPLSGRRAGANPPATTSQPNSARTGTATGGAKPKTSGVTINPAIANALKGGAASGGDPTQKKKAVGFDGTVDLGRGMDVPLGDSHNSLASTGGQKPGFLSDSEDDDPKAGSFGKFGGSKSFDDTTSIDTRLVTLVESVRRGWGLVRRQSQVGSPSDAELKKMEDQKKELERTKIRAAQEISSWGRHLALDDPDEYLEDFADFIDRLVMETDAKGGNLELVRVCIEHFTPSIDFPNIISERQWIVNSAADGSIGYMEIFLQVPNVNSTFSMDLPEIVATCCYNQTCRIPMMALLLKYDKDVIRFADIDCFEDCQDYFQEFWEEVASSKKAIPREDRTGRVEVLSKLLGHPAIGPTLTMDGEESGDGMNIFQRAAYEGDYDVLHLMLVKHKGCVKDVNQVLGDNMTALIQATMKDHTQCVQLLLDQPGIDVSIRCPEGTALEIARLLKRNPLLIAALEKAQDG